MGGYGGVGVRWGVGGWVGGRWSSPFWKHCNTILDFPII